MYKWIILICAMLLSGQVRASDVDADFGSDETQASLNALEAPSADSPKTDSEENKKQMSELVKELNLMPQQRDKAKQISDTNRAKMEQLQNNLKSILQQARDLEEQNLNEFAEILTDEQKAKFYEFKALRNDEMKAHDDTIDDIMAPFNE